LECGKNFGRLDAVEGFECHQSAVISSVAELVIIAVWFPAVIPKHDYQDHSSRLFQLFLAVSRKLSPAIGFDGFTGRVSVATNSPPENNSE
jgi:hypothetical protein